jgi:hypothetical protein
LAQINPSLRSVRRFAGLTSASRNSLRISERRQVVTVASLATTTQEPIPGWFEAETHDGRQRSAARVTGVAWLTVRFEHRSRRCPRRPRCGPVGREPEVPKDPVDHAALSTSGGNSDGRFIAAIAKEVG